MKQDFLSDKSVIFAGTKPEEVSAYLARHIVSHDLQLSGAQTKGAQLKHRRLAALDICQASFATAVRLSARVPEHTYLLQMVLSGSCERHGDADSRSQAGGELVISNPLEPLQLACSADCELLLVKIPASLFDEVCHEHGWVQPRRKASFDGSPRACSELPNLCGLLSLLCQEIEGGTATPQILQHYARTLACKLLTRFDNNIGMARNDQKSECYRRLVDYIEQNIKDDISVETLARHANLSPRSLYLLFEKYANTTPRNFIRQKKLEQVYATLMDPARNIINVTAVALDYGFTHLGRFSEFYRSTYGVLPSDALRDRHAGKTARSRSGK
jgi:AraC-like DNA-binding protein